MSDTANKHKDRLIEDALALLQNAVDQQFDTKNTPPPVRFGAVETSVVMATQNPDGQMSVIAASSVEIPPAPEPEQQQVTPSPPAIQHQIIDGSAPERGEHAPAGLVAETLSMMRTVTVVEPKTAVPFVKQPGAKLPSPQSWLDIERADMRTRVEAFKATQQRFQREREEYCAAALAAARAGEWRPQQP